MAEGKPDQEPSIEEILASIRQIISDDEQPPTAVPSDPEPADEPEDDVFELTESMKEDPEPVEIKDEEVNLDDDFDIALAEINKTLANDIAEETEETMVAPPPPPPPPAASAAPVEDDFDNILSERAKSAALSSMAKLASGMPISKPAATPKHYDGVTLEDIVRDLLNPMLRDWMDQNLPPMVERLVQKELEKLARKAMDA